MQTVEKFKVVAQRSGWTPEYANGHSDGEACRLRGTAPSTYLRVGVDEYAKGFRAGYFGRPAVPAAAPAHVPFVHQIMAA